MSSKEQQELKDLLKTDPRFFFEQEFFCKMYLDNPDKTIKTLIDLREAGGVYILMRNLYEKTGMEFPYFEEQFRMTFNNHKDYGISTVNILMPPTEKDYHSKNIILLRTTIKGRMPMYVRCFNPFCELYKAEYLASFSNGVYRKFGSFALDEERSAVDYYKSYIEEDTPDITLEFQ